MGEETEKRGREERGEETVMGGGWGRDCDGRGIARRQKRNPGFFYSGIVKQFQRIEIVTARSLCI